MIDSNFDLLPDVSLLKCDGMLVCYIKLLVKHRPYHSQWHLVHLSQHQSALKIHMSL